MTPTLEPGDLVVVVRPGRLRAGELVLLGHPTRLEYEVVKRVIALPGEQVAGRVLADGEVWVLGDNASRSTDSRSLGPIGMDTVRGVVRFRYWPITRIGRLP